MISIVTAFMTAGLPVNPSLAQQTQETDSYPVGNPMGMTVDGDFQPISSNVSVYGAINNAESCIYDAERDLIIVPSRGVSQSVQQNDA
ncbi:MAG: hypothetical protein ACNS64_11220, partial [Candidatus Halalkalibacterium sp. M3_1C_030]